MPDLGTALIPEPILTAATSELVLPSTDEEVWRYSRIDELDLSRYREPTSADTADRTLDAALDAVLQHVGDVAGLALVRNGRIVRCDLEADVAKAGVRFGLAGDAADPSGESPHVDVFAELNATRSSAPVVLDVPRGVRVDRPIAVVDWLDADGVMVFPRLDVRLGEGAEATVVEWHGSADVDSFTAPVTTLAVDQAAVLGHVVVQHRGPRVWQIANQLTSVGKDASFNGHQAALGGDYARSRADCQLTGRGASGNLSAVYFGAGAQMLDFRTFQDHRAPDTTSNLLFKGAVGGHSRSVYTGLIRVEKNARGTNAFQTNRNIKLSDHAWAESVPNLEIENNDVRCSHASTVGPVDEEQRFYLESRGVPSAIAERLIVAGFFDEVLSRQPVAGVADGVRHLVQERIEHVGDQP